MVVVGAALNRGARRASLKRREPQGWEDTSHVGLWGTDCLVEGMVGAKILSEKVLGRFQVQGKLVWLGQGE